MSKNSAQQGNKEQGNDSQPINHQPYGQEVWGPDGKGNIYFFEASAAPMKSRVVTLDEKGAHTDYVNQSWELRAGDKLNDDIRDAQRKKNDDAKYEIVNLESELKEIEKKIDSVKDLI